MINRAGIGALGVYVLHDSDGGELSYTIFDDDHPDGGYIKSMPLVPNVDYLLVPINTLVGTKKGLTMPTKAGKG